MKLQVVARLALIIVLAGAFAHVTFGLAADAVDAQPAGPLPACEEEDSRNCFWDADVAGAGNGGVSFVDIDGVAYYPETAR